MSTARERMLADIRASLKRTGPLPESVTRGLDQRMKKPVVNPQPIVEGDVVEFFISKLRAVNATVTHVTDLAAVSKVVAEHLKRHHLEPTLVVAPDPALEGVKWSNRFSIERRAAVGTDRVSVTGAFAGVAESGSLMLLSSHESPTTLNFLPDDHIIIVQADRIVRHPEDAWALLRRERRRMPRTINFITGPSKTADVELVMQEGAHGPRRFHVVIAGG